MSSRSQPIQKQSAAAIFRQEQNRILEEFVARVKAQIPAAAGKNEYALTNSIPTLLDHLILRLADGESQSQVQHHIRLISETHAEERADLGDFTLDQFIEEYSLLRLILIETLGMYGPIDPPTAISIHQMVDQGIAAAGRKFADRTAAQIAEKSEEAMLNFRSLTESTPQILWSASGSGMGEYFNHQWTVYTGMSEEESKGEGWKRAIHPDDLQYTMLRWTEALQSTQPMVFEERLRRHDGVYRWHQVRVNPALAPDGNLRWYGVSIDIHDQKTREAGLRQELQWLETVVDSLPVPIALVTSGSDEIQFLNEGARHLPFKMPWVREEYENGPCFATDSKGRRLKYDELPRVRLARGEALGAVDVTWHSPHGEIQLIVSGRRIPETPGHPSLTVVCFIDVTEQRRAAQELRKGMEELMEERSIRDGFVATLTHDMRTPLQSAGAAAQLIVRYPEKTDRHLSWATRVIESLKRIDRMIDDLLDANRIRAGQGISVAKTESDLMAVIREVVDDLNLSSENRIVLEGSEPFIPAYFDPSGMRRVFENLISNAVKYGNSETPITVRVSADSKIARVSVHNFGAEIDPEMQKVLFEPFRRSQTSAVLGKKGWGLGLPLVKGIVEAHGGSVAVVSEEGAGTTFTVEFPRRDPNTRPKARPQVPAPE